MVDQLTKANINIYAVLRNLEDLIDIDEEMKDLIKDKDISIYFVVKNGPKAHLQFKDGKCSFREGKGKCNIKLFFKSPEHLNQMFEGKANPIPLKGLTKISFLKNEFTKMTDKLAYYLKPNETLLNDAKYFKINTVLTAYTAFFSLAQIANTDKIGKVNSKRIPDGVVSISVLNGPSVNLNVKEGHIEAKKGPGKSPRAFMTFDSIGTANAILNGKIDSYTAIGTGRFVIKGYVPMIDNMNKILAMVPSYLK